MRRKKSSGYQAGTVLDMTFLDDVATASNLKITTGAIPYRIKHCGFPPPHLVAVDGVRLRMWALPEIVAWKMSRRQYDTPRPRRLSGNQ